jgi:hypothetical protein
MPPPNIVIMQHGARWPHRVLQDGPGCIVLAQLRSEPHSELSMRARARVEGVVRSVGPIDLGVLVCNGVSHESGFLERAGLADILAQAVRHSPRGRLMLYSAESAHRVPLLDLAERLMFELQGSAALVSLVVRPSGGEHTTAPAAGRRLEVSRAARGRGKVSATVTQLRRV